MSDRRRKIEALLADENFYFGKACERRLKLHDALLKPPPAAWEAFLGEGGGASSVV